MYLPHISLCKIAQVQSSGFKKLIVVLDLNSWFPLPSGAHFILLFYSLTTCTHTHTHKHFDSILLFFLVQIYLLDIYVFYTIISAVWGFLLGARDRLGEVWCTFPNLISFRFFCYSFFLCPSNALCTVVSFSYQSMSTCWRNSPFFFMLDMKLYHTSVFL